MMDPMPAAVLLAYTYAQPSLTLLHVRPTLPTPQPS